MRGHQEVIVDVDDLVVILVLVADLCALLFPCPLRLAPAFHSFSVDISPGIRESHLDCVGEAGQIRSPILAGGSHPRTVAAEALVGLSASLSEHRGLDIQQAGVYGLNLLEQLLPQLGKLAL